MTIHQGGRERRRRFIRRHLPWIVPLALVVGSGLFIVVGFLVAWLWRVTVGDIFGLKSIGFWQAWGLILLSQILFKGNVQPMMRTGSRRYCVPAGEDSPEMKP